jgi:hypothetical protein
MPLLLPDKGGVLLIARVMTIGPLALMYELSELGWVRAVKHIELNLADSSLGWLCIQ